MPASLGLGLGLGQAVPSAELGLGEPSVIPRDWDFSNCRSFQEAQPMALAGAVSQQVTVGPGGLREVALPWADVVFHRGDSCVQAVAGTSSRGIRRERKYPLEQAVNQKPPPLPSLDGSSQHL